MQMLLKLNVIPPVTGNLIRLVAPSIGHLIRLLPIDSKINLTLQSLDIWYI